MAKHKAAEQHPELFDHDTLVETVHDLVHRLEVLEAIALGEGKLVKLEPATNGELVP